MMLGDLVVAVLFRAPDIPTAVVLLIFIFVTVWMTTAEMAKYARVGIKTIYKEIRSGRLRVARVGGRREYRGTEDWTDEWLEESATPVVLPIRRRA